MLMMRMGLCGLALSGLLACSHVPDSAPVTIESTSRQDSAPDEKRDVSAILEPIPQPVIRTRAGNKSPYTVFGKTYYLLPQSQGYRERGDASWYGTKFHGRKTSNGEPYDMWGMTAAHKTLPIPSYVRVTNLNNGRSIIVRVNDRGPFHEGRIIDLSYAGAVKLGFASEGVAPVEVVDVTPREAIEMPNVLPANQAILDEPSDALPKTANSVETVTATTLQVAAFQQQQKAVELQQQLETSLGDTIPVNVVQFGEWYRVRVGPINEQEVEQLRKMLLEQGIASPVPVLK